MDDLSAAFTEEEYRRSSMCSPGGVIMPEPFCFTDFEGQTVHEREWIVQDWLPVGCVTINYANGGEGKTMLAQQLMTSCVTGKPWIGREVMQGPVLGIFCEDDQDELHRRQERINQAYKTGYRDLADMYAISRIGEDSRLITFDTDYSMRDKPFFIKTPFLAWIEETAFRLRVKLIALDTAADLFCGNENDRAQVRAFVSTLNRLAMDIGAAVLLNAHPSRSGLSATGDMDGGSTGWSNSSRSRWSLTRPPTEEKDPRNPDRILTRRKSNYATPGDTIPMRWENGVLVPRYLPAGLTALAHNDAVDATFLKLLAKISQENRPVSSVANAGNFAPKLFASRPDRDGYSKGDFKAAMERLFVAKKITNEEYGRQGGAGRPRMIVLVQ